jgi:hypothetical protein
VGTIPPPAEVAKFPITISAVNTGEPSVRTLASLTPPTILQAAAGTASPVLTPTCKTHAAMGASVTLAVRTIPEVANRTKPPILMQTVNAGA